MGAHVEVSDGEFHPRSQPSPDGWPTGGYQERGSRHYVPAPRSITTGKRGDRGGVNIQVHAGMISLPEVGDEGWLDR